MKKLLLSSFFGILFLIPQNNSAQQKPTDLGSYFGDIRARHIGPALMSGRINDLELHPNNPRIIYAGAAGGGVWNLMMEDQPLIQFSKIIVNP